MNFLNFFVRTTYNASETTQGRRRRQQRRRRRAVQGRPRRKGRPLVRALRPGRRGQHSAGKDWSAQTSATAAATTLSAAAAAAAARTAAAARPAAELVPQSAGVNVIKLFLLSLMTRHYKLEDLSLETLTSQVLEFEGKDRANQTGAPFWCFLLG